MTERRWSAVSHVLVVSNIMAGLAWSGLAAGLQSACYGTGDDHHRCALMLCPMDAHSALCQTVDVLLAAIKASVPGEETTRSKPCTAMRTLCNRCRTAISWNATLVALLDSCACCYYTSNYILLSRDDPVHVKCVCSFSNGAKAGFRLDIDTSDADLCIDRFKITWNMYYGIMHFHGRS